LKIVGAMSFIVRTPKPDFSLTVESRIFTEIEAKLFDMIFVSISGKADLLDMMFVRISACLCAA